MGIFDKRPLDEFYLDCIAKYDKKIAKNKENIKKYGNNKFTIAAFQNNVKLFENQRAKIKQALAKYRSEQQKGKGVNIE